MIAYLVVFAASAAATFLATPFVRKLVIRMGAIDYPGDRKVHPKPTPTMGGVAMYIGVLAGLGVSRSLSFFAEMNRGSPEPLAVLVTCSLMVGLGAIDDKRGTSALAKLTAQIFIAGVLVIIGVQLFYFWLPGGREVVLLTGGLGAPLTIMWVILVANAVNLIDGLDGLAAGMVAIAATAVFIYVVHTPSIFGLASAAALVSAIAAGVCVGFLPWNFNPAKIFMGDSGSMLLGMLLVIATISGFARNPLPPSRRDLPVLALPIFLPMVVLAVPFLDVMLAVARRVWRGQGIGHADKLHIHHRLMDIGHSHRQAVLLLYLWSTLISGSALALGLVQSRFAVGVIVIGAALLFLITALPRLGGRGRGGPLQNPL